MVFVFPYSFFKSDSNALRKTIKNKVKHRNAYYRRCKERLLSKVQERIIRYLIDELQPCRVSLVRNNIDTPRDTNDLVGGFQYNYQFMLHCRWLHKQIRDNGKDYFFNKECISELFFENRNNINFKEYKQLLKKNHSRVDVDIPHINNMVLEAIQFNLNSKLRPILIFDINIDRHEECFLKVYYKENKNGNTRQEMGT